MLAYSAGVSSLNTTPPGVVCPICRIDTSSQEIKVTSATSLNLDLRGRLIVTGPDDPVYQQRRDKSHGAETTDEEEQDSEAVRAWPGIQHGSCNQGREPVWRVADDGNHAHPKGRVDSDKPLAPMSWAQLLKRVFAIDIETCPDCGGKLRVIACVEEPALIRKILGHVRAREALVVLEARAPPADHEEASELS